MVPGGGTTYTRIFSLHSSVVQCDNFSILFSSCRRILEICRKPFSRRLLVLNSDTGLAPVRDMEALCRKVVLDRRYASTGGVSAPRTRLSRSPSRRIIGGSTG